MLFSEKHFHKRRDLPPARLLHLKKEEELPIRVRLLMERTLSEAEYDEKVGIRHAPMPGGNETYRRHIAGIDPRRSVNCHYHRKGKEDYYIVRGKGRLHWGEVTEGADGKPVVTPKEPIDVVQGQRFIIRPGYAHQLENTGPGELALLFGCPDSHLVDTKDRTMLPDMKTLKQEGKKR